jgi:lipopolysaccharide export LptBFGC system permease protein LptF
MKIKNGMKVIAPIGCCDYLTEGKEYEVFDVAKLNNNYTFNIVDDDGESIFSRLNDSTHLNDGNWIIKQETATPRNLTTTTVKYKNCTFDVSGVWSGEYVEETNEKPEFELHTIEINRNDLTELLTQEDIDGIVEMLMSL